MTLSDIRPIVRKLIEDNSKTDKDLFTYESSDVFSLTESNVVSVSDVFVNDTELGSGQWSYDSADNKVTLVAGNGSSNDTIEIEYSYYPNYSDTELEDYIESALTHIAVNNYKTFIVENNTIYPEPTEKEKYLIATITALIINPDNVSYRLPDIAVTKPRDLPLHDKISKTIGKFKKDNSGVFDVLG